MDKLEIEGNIFARIEISAVPKEIALPQLYENGACLQNSVLCARNNDDVTIIEGLVLVIPKDQEKYKSGVIKHAWNVIKDIYFDVTQENVWGVEYEKLLYFGLIGKDETEYGITSFDFDSFVIKAQETIIKEIESK